MRATTVCISLLLSSLALAADRPEIPLWTNGAPGSEGKTAKEVDEPPNKDHGYLKVTGVHNPSITVFLPPREMATGAAMVIAPGGGQFLNFDQEGTYVAEYLNSIGVAGFVLKYRLAREPGSTYKIEEHALADAQRAIRLIRARAADWRVNPARAGIMGFSAGGEVAALADKPPILVQPRQFGSSPNPSMPQPRLSPEETHAIIHAAAIKNNVPAAFVKSIMAAESNFNRAAVSGKGAMGLMQLMPETAQEYGIDPTIPAQNVDGGAHYLSALIARYRKSGDWLRRVIAAYNAGPGVVDRYRGIPPYRETRAYVGRVLGYLRRFRKEG